jgi:hypothetical protein
MGLAAAAAAQKQFEEAPMPAIATIKPSSAESGQI